MNEFPEFSEFGIAAIKLLQGVVYEEDKDVWAILLANESDVETYFCRIGTNVVIDRSNGLAYLKQFSDDQRVDGYERLPRLVTRSPLSYHVTLGCVLLRDAYRRFEDEDLENERCVIETEALFDSWKSFFPQKEDDVSLRKKLTTCLSLWKSLNWFESRSRNLVCGKYGEQSKPECPLHSWNSLISA